MKKKMEVIACRTGELRWGDRGSLLGRRSFEFCR